MGGNVSLYNEGATAGPIYPTPVIGMVGSLPDVRRAGRLGFVREGDSIALVGPFAPHIDASELAKLWGHALPDGLAPVDIGAVAGAQAVVREAVRAGGVSSVHDIAEGGLAVALAECCLAGELGAVVRLEDDALEDDALGALFGEGSGGFVVSGSDDALRELGATTPLSVLGRVGGDVLRIEVPTRADAGGRVGQGEREVSGEGEVAGQSEVPGQGSTIELTLAELADAHGALKELFA